MLQVEINKIEEKFLGRLPKESGPDQRSQLMSAFETQSRQSQITIDEAQIPQESQVEELSPAKLALLQQLYNRENPIKPVKFDSDQIYSEADIYPEGLPDPEDVKQKKKKRLEEKYIFEECPNPGNTPRQVAKSKSDRK